MHEAFLLLIQALHPTDKQNFLSDEKHLAIWHLIANSSETCLPFEFYRHSWRIRQLPVRIQPVFGK